LYAILIARRKLRRYFESHPIMIVSSFPLREVIQSREAMGRIAPMGEGITYAPGRPSSPRCWQTLW
jgi:hypothetical protein